MDEGTITVDGMSVLQGPKNPEVSRCSLAFALAESVFVAPYIWTRHDAHQGFFGHWYQHVSIFGTYLFFCTISLRWQGFWVHNLITLLL
jgi:hypothetical protein